MQADRLGLVIPHRLSEGLGFATHTITLWGRHRDFVLHYHLFSWTMPLHSVPPPPLDGHLLIPGDHKRGGALTIHHPEVTIITVIKRLAYWSHYRIVHRDLSIFIIGFHQAVYRIGATRNHHPVLSMWLLLSRMQLLFCWLSSSNDQYLITSSHAIILSSLYCIYLFSDEKPFSRRHFRSPLAKESEETPSAIDESERFFGNNRYNRYIPRKLIIMPAELCTLFRNKNFVCL